MCNGRIMIAGTNSGCGKTTVVCGLLKCLLNRKMNIHAFKCGPDYIDTSFHKKVLKIPTGNLDSWFCKPEDLRKMVSKKADKCDIAVIEGVMGYYDGMGFTQRASAYEIADITSTPVILIINCKGMSSSLEAVLSGFVNMKQNSHIKGVIFNRLSEKLYRYAKECALKLGVQPLGYIPSDSSLHIESRHLGLVGADEIKSFDEKLEHLADVMEKTVDIDAVMKLAKTAEKLEYEAEKDVGTDSKSCVNIAIAKDEAFCFLYDDNIAFLEENGCRIMYFSPIHDSEIPHDADGVIFWGGYPERYAKELSENKSMIKSVKKVIDSGIACIAECGGFLYLHSYLEGTDGKKYPMAGIIDGEAVNGKRMQRFGYMEVTPVSDGMACRCMQPLKTHEFHYWKSCNPGSDFQVKKVSDESISMAGYNTEKLYAAFMHIYFFGNEEFGMNFIKKSCEYAAKKHWNNIAKPLNGLGDFEDIIVKIAGIQNTEHVDISKKALVIMCADNGIVEENVSQSGQDVTAIVAANMASRKSSVCLMAGYTGAQVIPVDIGIACETIPSGKKIDDMDGILHKKISHGTKNFLKEHAMTDKQCIKAIETGKEIVKMCSEKGINIIATGEMGIGNTTTSAALAAILLDEKPENVTGYGAGLTNEGLKNKTETVRKACEMYSGYKDDALKLLSCIGGLDIAGLAGVFIGGAEYGIPVVIDGLISGIAALTAEYMSPGTKKYMIASHAGKEPALKKILTHLELKPVIDANLALGEGSGAVMVFPLLDMAMSVYNESNTFENIDMEAYECLH